MRTFILPDFTQIDLVQTNKVGGPSQKYGLHYGKAYYWYRVNGGEWKLSKLRTLNRFAEWCKMCESIADFKEGESEE